MSGRFIILIFLFYLPSFCNSSKKNIKTNLDSNNLPLVFSINFIGPAITVTKANSEIDLFVRKRLKELKIYCITEAKSEELYRGEISDIFNYYLNKKVDMTLYKNEAAKKITNIPAISKKIRFTIFCENQTTDSIQIISELYPNGLEKQRPQKISIVNYRILPQISFISDVIDSCRVKGLF